MSWAVYIKINEAQNNFKFWSYDQENVVAYGRIGHSGRQDQRSQVYIANKIAQKMDRGYRLYSRNHPTPSPTPSEARAFWRGNLDERSNSDWLTPGSQRSQRTQRTQDWDGGPTLPSPHSTTSAPSVSVSTPARSTSTRPKPRVSHISIPRVESYKTDAQGFIANYRRGYERKIFDEFFSSLYLVPINRLVNSELQPINPNSEDFKKAKEYFNRIPTSAQYNKPRRFVELRDPSRPTYGCVMRKKSRGVECLAIYGFNSRTGICDFLSLKSSAKYRKSLLKKIVYQLSNSFSGLNEMTFHLKSRAMLREIKSLADYSISYSGNNLKYRLSDLQTGITLPQAKPARWIE